ncbi:Inhibitor of growth protein 3 [Toxocara canis]|uniref:Inhibitor of growth protein 3 n=1 Tax=Toxocara canis TaxID=6265 RepID=A0A0B2VVV1_TOXCA|nr:Inhibitor of growth protein 3 [Toxocara canis]
MRQRRRSQSKTGSAANEKARDEEESSTSENSRVMHVAISAKTDLPRTERRDCYQMDDDEWMDEWTELIRDLPGDMRTRIEEIGALDSRIQRDLAQVHETANEFFEEASDLPPEQLAFLYAQLKEEYENIRKDAEEKVEMAEATVSLFLDYKQKIMAKISNFKEFLDARYPGMTEQIESTRTKGNTSGTSRADD